MLAMLLALTLVGCNKDKDKDGKDGGKHVDGVLQVDSPAAGAFVDAGIVTVTGTAANLTDVTVNGEPANVDGERFDRMLELPRGMATIEARGLDDQDHALFTRHAVLAGDFASAEGLVTDALELRLNQPGLDYIRDILVELMNPTELMSMLDTGGPIYNIYEPHSWPVDDTDVDIYLAVIDFQPLQVIATPRPERLELELVLPNPYIQLQTWGTIAYLSNTYGDAVHIQANEVRILADLELDVDASGNVHATLSAVDVSLPGFTASWDWAWETVNWFASFLDLEDAVGGLIEGALVSAAPGLIERAFSILDTTLSLELLGQTLDIDLVLSDISADSDGIRFYADLGVDIPEQLQHSAPGYLVAPAADPTPDPNAPLSVALSDNLMNRVLFEAWAAGMISLTMSTEDGSLDPFLLAALGGSAGSISVNANLPPVLVESGGKLQAQLGEVDLVLLTPGGDHGDRLEVSMAATADIDLSIEGGEIVIGLGDPDLSFVVRDSDWGVSNETITNLLVAELPIDVLLLLLGEFRFPLPVIEGFEIQSATTERDASGVYTDVSITLR